VLRASCVAIERLITRSRIVGACSVAEESLITRSRAIGANRIELERLSSKCSIVKAVRSYIWLIGVKRLISHRHIVAVPCNAAVAERLRRQSVLSNGHVLACGCVGLKRAVAAGRVIRANCIATERLKTVGR